LYPVAQRRFSVDMIDKKEYQAQGMATPDDRNDHRWKKKDLQIKGILLLLIAVSLTSCIIGFIIGRSVTTDSPTGYIMDTIPLSPDEQGAAAPKTYFKLTGRVLYTDGTPYANSRVELHSSPRYTDTDDYGYFYFEDVEPGSHIINVIRNGVIQASCTIEVDANERYTDSQIVQLDDGSFSIRISLDVSVLELTLVLDNGRITPQLNDSPSTLEDDRNMPEIPDQPKPPDIPEPANTPAPPFIPEPPVPPSPPAQGGGASTPPQPPGGPDRAPSIGVTGQGSSHSWSLMTTVDIFGDRLGNNNTRMINGQKVLSPGASGSYTFRVKNTEADDIAYGIRLTDNDENQPALPMKYRLKAGGAYIDGNQWQTAAELQAGTKILTPGDSDYYTLEWKWETVSDNNDTGIGTQTGNPRYILMIRINAQFK